MPWPPRPEPAPAGAVTTHGRAVDLHDLQEAARWALGGGVMGEPSNSRHAKNGRAKRSKNSSRPWEFMEDADRPSRCECRAPLLDPRELDVHGLLTCWWCGLEVRR